MSEDSNLSPSELAIRGLMIDGWDESDARCAARAVLGSLVAGGYVLKKRTDSEEQKT